MARQLRRAALVAALVVALDRATKLWVIEGLGLPRRLHVPVWDPWLNFTMAWNQGINFGLFDFGSAGRWVLVALALAIVAAVLVWVRRTRGWGPAAGVGLIVGGALGNVIDRVLHGHVIDFIRVHWGEHYFPAFNVADSAITIGAALIVLDNLLELDRVRAKKNVTSN